VLRVYKGVIADVSAFSSIGEEFGQARLNLDCLRYLRNTLRMDQVECSEPYALCEVLSAAVYKTNTRMHERWRRKLSGEGTDPDFSLSGQALGVAVEHFKRMILRSLDYLPPAGVSLADDGRVTIAADQVSHPDDKEERKFIRQEFTARSIVTNPKALEVETDFEHPAVTELDLEALVSDDRTAHDFADCNRGLLHIPDGVALNVGSRLDVTSYTTTGEARSSGPASACSMCGGLRK
jgi:hypothetical protein